MRYPHEDDADYEVLIKEIDRRVQASQWGAHHDNPQFDTDIEGIKRSVPQIAADCAYEILGKRMKLAGVRAFDLPALEREAAADVMKIRGELEVSRGQTNEAIRDRVSVERDRDDWKKRFDKLLDMALEKR